MRNCRGGLAFFKFPSKLSNISYFQHMVFTEEGSIKNIFPFSRFCGFFNPWLFLFEIWPFQSPASMEGHFRFTSRFDFSQTITLIPVLACGYGSRASNEALQNVHVVLTFGSSGFARISKTTCDVFLVFASSESHGYRTEFFKTPTSIIKYSKLHLNEQQRVWHRNYTFRTKLYHTIAL